MLQHCTAQCGMITHDCQTAREGLRETPYIQVHSQLIAQVVDFMILHVSAAGVENTHCTTWPEILNHRMFGYYILCNFDTSLVL
jgi:hypothetical protein